MSTLVFKVEELERKSTETKNGTKNFLRLKIEGGPWVSVWDPDDCNLILTNEGGSFKGDVTEDGKWKNLENVSLANGNPISSLVGPGTVANPVKGSEADRKSQATETDWRAKERREAFRIAWAVIYKTERDNQVTSDLAMEKALKFAHLVVSAAEGDAATYEAPFS